MNIKLPCFISSPFKKYIQSFDQRKACICHRLSLLALLASKRVATFINQIGVFPMTDPSDWCFFCLLIYHKNPPFM